MNLRNPDEIKRGLVEAIEEAAWVVEGGDAHDLLDAVDKAHASMADALSYIQQLERERDQAVKDLARAKDCINCKHASECKTGAHDCYHCHEKECPCLTCQYEWRGVQKEEDHE